MDYQAMIDTFNEYRQWLLPAGLLVVAIFLFREICRMLLGDDE